MVLLVVLKEGFENPPGGGLGRHLSVGGEEEFYKLGVEVVGIGCGAVGIVGLQTAVVG